MAKKGLGKGLDALFSDNFTESAVSAPAEGGAVMLRIADIEPDADQPRRTFSDESLAELAESIRAHGVIQPLVVRPVGGGKHLIVAGERRWRAARLAGLSEVPALVRELDAKQSIEIALVENLQREDLNPIEEALGYKRLMDEAGLTQSEAAGRVGKSRPYVANALRLLVLPDDAQQLVRTGLLSAGHARALVPLGKNASAAAKRAADEGLSVRQTEELAKRLAKPPKQKTGPEKEKPLVDYYGELAARLSRSTGRKVEISHGAKGGRIILSYYGPDDLEILAEKIEKM